MDVRRLVGQNLKRFRKAAGISQEELAHEAGIDRTYVSGIERGIKNPSVGVLQDLASVLKIKPVDLLREGR